RKTGKGQHIEVSQMESTASILETAILDYTANGRVRGRVGNRLPNAAPHGAYRCRGEDRWCVIAVFTDEEWRAFCRVIGNPPWTKEDRFATLLARKQNEDELDRLVEEWTKERTPEEVMVLMQREGVPAGVVQNAEDMLLRDPQLRAREHYVYLDHAEAGRTAYDGVPFKLSATPGRPLSAAPLLGEHNDYVYREILGMSEEEANEYIVEGVFA
ncbi:MAG: CoA transferase, partial [Chloroflexota bacterium]|nr:CoA transferase [Chloroflexota bacterium]